MSDNQYQIPIDVPEELEKPLAELKQSDFPDKSMDDVLRYLLLLGLESVKNSETNPEKTQPKPL